MAAFRSVRESHAWRISRHRLALAKGVQITSICLPNLGRMQTYQPKLSFPKLFALNNGPPGELLRRIELQWKQLARSVPAASAARRILAEKEGEETSLLSGEY